MRVVKYNPEDDHEHECFGTGCRKAGSMHGSWWSHQDPDCQYPQKYDCPLCDGAPNDWAIDSDEEGE